MKVFVLFLFISWSFLPAKGKFSPAEKAILNTPWDGKTSLEYRDKRLGFSFKYPSSGFISETFHYPINTSENKIKSQIFLTSKKGRVITINVYILKNAEGKIKSEVKKLFKNYFDARNEVESLKIGSFHALKFFFSGNRGGVARTEVFLKHKKLLFQFVLIENFDPAASVAYWRIIKSLVFATEKER